MKPLNGPTAWTLRMQRPCAICYFTLARLSDWWWCGGNGGGGGGERCWGRRSCTWSCSESFHTIPHPLPHSVWEGAQARRPPSHAAAAIEERWRRFLMAGAAATVSPPGRPPFAAPLKRKREPQTGSLQPFPVDRLPHRLSDWCQSREEMVWTGEIKKRERGVGVGGLYIYIYIKEGNQMTGLQVMNACLLQSVPGGWWRWEWREWEVQAGGKRRFVWINTIFFFLFEGDVRNWDSGGIVDVPGLCMPQTQDARTHAHTFSFLGGCKPHVCTQRGSRALGDIPPSP